MLVLFNCISSSMVKHLKLCNLAKSPVFNHLVATLQGLTTIRALKSEHRSIKTFDELQVGDSHILLTICILLPSSVTNDNNHALFQYRTFILLRGLCLLLRLEGSQSGSKRFLLHSLL